MSISPDYKSCLSEIYISVQDNYSEYLGQCPCMDHVEQVCFKTDITSLLNRRKETNEVSDKLFLRVENLVTEPVNNHFSIFNPIMGTLLALNRFGYDFIQQFREPAYLDDIIKNRFPVSRHTAKKLFAFLQVYGILYQADKERSIPPDTPCQDIFTVWLHLSNQCNLSCKYCYVEKTSESMHEHTARHAVASIFATAASKGYKKVKIKYAGGEPTLQANLLIQIHCSAESLAKAYGLEIEGNILTNGVTIPAKLIEFSQDHNIKWAVSLDGLEMGHDAQRPLFNGKTSSGQVISSIDKLQQHDIFPHIPITLTRNNLSDIPSLVEFLLKRKLHFSLNFYRYNKYCAEEADLYPPNDDLILALRRVYGVIERDLPDYSLLSLLLDRVDLRIPHEYPCTAGHHYITIGHSGFIAPCQMFVSLPTDLKFDFDPELCIIPEFKFKNFKNPAVFEKQGCADCLWQYFCTGGCPIDAYNFFGAYDIPSPYCSVYRTLAPDVLRLEVMRILKYQEPLCLN